MVISLLSGVPALNIGRSARPACSGKTAHSAHLGTSRVRPRGEGKIEVLAQEHELFRQHYRRLEGNDAVLHPVNDQQTVLQRFAVVNGRDAMVDIRVRMRQSHEGNIVRPKEPGVYGWSTSDTGLERPGFRKSAITVNVPP